MRKQVVSNEVSVQIKDVSVEFNMTPLIVVAAFILGLAFLIGGAPAVLTALWWLLLAFVVVCGAAILLSMMAFAFGLYLALRRT